MAGAARTSRLRLVLAGALARYPQGGGHWALFLQYILGLRDLAHDVLWLDVLVSTGTRAGDESRARLLFKRFEQYGLRDACALLVVDRQDEQDLRTARAYGVSKRRLAEFFRTADLLWNFAAGVRPPLLSLFRHRVLVDGDPGHLQISAQMSDLGLQHHQMFLTSGTKLGDADHGVPLLACRGAPSSSSCTCRCGRSRWTRVSRRRSPP